MRLRARYRRELLDRTVVINCFAADTGGINRVAESITRELSREYNVVVELAPRNFSSVRQVTLASKQSETRWRSLLKLPLRASKYLIWRPAYTINVGPSLSLAFAKKTNVVIVHDLAFLDPANSGIRFSQKIYRHVVTYLALVQASKVISVSPATTREINTHYPRFAHKVKTIKLPVSQMFRENLVSKKPSKSPNSPFSVLAFGHNHNKGVQTLIYALKVEPRISAKIISNRTFWEVSGHSNLIQELGLESRIEVLYGLSDQELFSAFESSDVFVMPSTYEGYGLPVGESLALGMPTVISPLPVLAETGMGYAVQMADFSPESLVLATQIAMQIPSTVWERASKILSEDSWELWVRKLHLK